MENLKFEIKDLPPKFRVMALDIRAKLLALNAKYIAMTATTEIVQKEWMEDGDRELHHRLWLRVTAHAGGEGKMMKAYFKRLTKRLVKEGWRAKHESGHDSSKLETNITIVQNEYLISTW